MYEFWLTRGTDRIRFPVNPETIAVSSPFGYTDVEVAQLGEVTIFGNREPKEITISSFWPAEYNPSYCSYSGFMKPWDFVNKIEGWRDRKVQYRLTITGTGINIVVTIRDFQYEERAGSVGDIYFSITLKEYRTTDVRWQSTVPKKTTTTKPSRPPSTKKTSVTLPRTYTVKKNDSLWKIAKAYYGAGSQWRKIYNANTKVIGKNPNKIEPGMKLVIPK
ncbi:MAG: LysM peptidoglycan-binding domain-containing protein [Acidobacterium ailaaui]|nr:LysM peptidoglycan-binding domain-containing protein [Pseudacidobacterium ailaaui]